jgi:hypothetical protein
VKDRLVVGEVATEEQGEGWAPVSLLAAAAAGAGGVAAAAAAAAAAGVDTRHHLQ